jgi:YHS domain-containing protein
LFDIFLKKSGGFMKFYRMDYLVILTALFVLATCATEKKSEGEMKSAVKSEKSIDITADMLTTTTDLVCGMDLTEHAIKDTTIYKDQLYGFCSEYCKQKFMEDPETLIAKMVQPKP